MRIEELTVDHSRIAKGLQIRHNISALNQKKDTIDADKFSIFIQDDNGPHGGVTFDLSKSQKNKIKSLIIGEIENRARLLRRAEILPEEEPNETKVQLEDFIKLKMVRPNKTITTVIRLSGFHNPEKQDEYTHVSVNSPIGASIFNQEIGAEFENLINNVPVQFTIIEKVDPRGFIQSDKKIR